MLLTSLWSWHWPYSPYFPIYYFDLFLKFYKIKVVITWILHAPEAFICKAFKGEAIVNYGSALITQQMEASGSPAGWKLMR